MTTTLVKLRNTSKYRDYTDIMAQVLHAANGGSTTTKVMNKTYLSYEQLKQYTAILSASELLAFDRKIKIFRTTPKGLQFIEMYNRLNKLLGFATTDNPKKGYLIRRKK